MIITTWNIRGINQPHKQSYIRKFAEEYSIDVLGILETKVKARNQDKIQKSVLPKCEFWNNNNSTEDEGRIWIAWNPVTTTVQLIKYSGQYVHVRIEKKIDKKVSFEATFVYALYEIVDRSLWQHLRLFAHTTGGQPWVCLRDFNVSLDPNEIDEVGV